MPSEKASCFTAERHACTPTCACLSAASRPLVTQSLGELAPQALAAVRGGTAFTLGKCTPKQMLRYWCCLAGPAAAQVVLSMAPLCT